MVLSKVVEMFAEAIPAGVLQMSAFILSQNRTFTALGSIIISALTTGFGSALISYGESLRRGGMLMKVSSPLTKMLRAHTHAHALQI